MKREIKFRAWDGKTMFTPNVIAFAECGWSCGTGRGMSIPYQPHITLMQFTGKKDSKENEIYEGDWVERGDKIMEVIFDNGCFYTPYNKSKYRLGGWEKQSLTVIGNIYQNPELITP